jgi:hypothetical protein
MSPTQKGRTKPKRARAVVASVHARFEENDRVIGRIAESLEVAQNDLAKLGGSLEAGAGDLRRSLTRLLRDARRDATKMSKATRKDLERLQKDIAAAAKAGPRAGRAKARTATASTRSTATRAKATAKPKAKAAGKAKTKAPAKAKAKAAVKAKSATRAKAKTAVRAKAAKPRATGARAR